MCWVILITLQEPQLALLLVPLPLLLELPLQELLLLQVPLMHHPALRSGWERERSLWLVTVSFQVTLKEVPLWVKMLSNSTGCYREIVHERKSQLKLKTSLLAISRNFHSYPNLQQLSPWSVSSHQYWPCTNKEIKIHWRLRRWLAIFSNKVFLN